MKLNIGCGCVWLPDYTNVDREGYAKICQWATMAGKPLPVVGSAEFVQHDLTLNWPWQSDTVEEILADNFLEHLENLELTHLLREALRVLVPGGRISGRVPDFARVWKLYTEGSQWDWFPGATVGPFPEPAMNALHNYCYGWGHKQVFTREMLQTRLQGAGFVTQVVPVEEVGLYFRATKS